MSDTKELIERLQGLAGKAQFVSFLYRDKKAGELARHTLILGCSYRKQIEESLLALELLRPTLTQPIELLAFAEIEQSLKDTITALDNGTVNPRYTKPEAYVPICQGLKYCISGGTINVSGLSHARVVVEAGNWPHVNHKPLTVAKNDIRGKLPVNRWREFVIAPENLLLARLQGVELVLN